MATFDNILNANLNIDMNSIPDNKLNTGNDKY